MTTKASKADIQKQLQAQRDIIANNRTKIEDLSKQIADAMVNGDDKAIDKLNKQIDDKRLEAMRAEDLIPHLENAIALYDRDEAIERFVGYIQQTNETRKKEHEVKKQIQPLQEQLKPLEKEAAELSRELDWLGSVRQESSFELMRKHDMTQDEINAIYREHKQEVSG